MRTRYKPRYDNDRYLGRHGCYDLYVNAHGKILTIRWGDDPTRDEAAADNCSTKAGIAMQYPHPADRAKAFEHCWDLARGNIKPDPSVSPNA